MDVLQFIQDNYLVLVMVCMVIGYGIKNTELIDDRYIPGILIIFGGILGGIMSIEGDLSVLNGVLQGLLCGGAAVGANQVKKQLQK